MPAVVLGDYRLIATLGRGGMAEVFLAVRSGLVGFHKLVVIKRLRPDLGELPEASRYRGLLLDEARLAARLRHPNIVQTFEVGDQFGQPFIAMEYLDGQSLSRVLTKARRAGIELPVPLAIRIVKDVLRALAYAHDLTDYDGVPLQIVHRDVSPQNVCWTYDGEIKLVDFGVAKVARTGEETEAGVVKGKLTYMAPEQARGLPIDRRADVFAAGILLWELIAGRRLLRAATPAASMQRLLFEDLPALTRMKPGIDPELSRICDRALARDLDARYPSAAAMREDLDRAFGKAASSDELAAFIQPLCTEERTAISQQIHDAITGDGAPFSLMVSELTSAHMHTAETVIEPVAPVTQPPARTPRRRWPVIALATAVFALSGVDVALWQSSRSDDDNAPTLAAATPQPAALHTLRVPDLRLCGSNTIGAELAPALVAAFLAHEGAVRVEREPGPELTRFVANLRGSEVVVEIRAAGTATAFEGLATGVCDLGMASRAINAKESADLAAKGHGDLRSPATEHVLGLDGIAVVVHPNNPLVALDRMQLQAIFSGAFTDWAQVGGGAGPITVFARDAKSGTFDTFKHLVLAGGDVPPEIRRFSHGDALADAVAGDPLSIGFIGLAYVRSAKALAVGESGALAMLPTSFTVTTEDYMLSRRLYLYTTPKPRSPLVTELVSYALSGHGQAVVRDTNFVDLTVALRDPERCDARCPSAYAALVARARRISLNFRFRSGSEGVDSRASRDLDRIVQLLRVYPDHKLMLLGFSDNTGDPSANARLSRHRAATIDRELAIRGVHATVVQGFGDTRPVASNATEAGRERNRRVEAWLEPSRSR